MDKKSSQKITIEKLADMMSRGFSGIRKAMATKEDLKTMVSKKDLEDLVTKKDLEDLAISVAKGFDEVRSEMATKENIKQLEERFDIKLDKFVGNFRRDHDILATRVKKLETVVLK